MRSSIRGARETLMPSILFLDCIAHSFQLANIKGLEKAAASDREGKGFASIARERKKSTLRRKNV